MKVLFLSLLLLSDQLSAQSTITGFVVTNVPACDGRLNWYIEDGRQTGQHLRCCNGFTISFTTKTNHYYQVMYRVWDGTGRQWSYWNQLSPNIVGYGTNAVFTSGIPEPWALLSVREQ